MRGGGGGGGGGGGVGKRVKRSYMVTAHISAVYKDMNMISNKNTQMMKHTNYGDKMLVHLAG